MTPETILVRHAPGAEYLSDFVRLMAVNARRERVGLFLPEFSPDHLAVDNFDLCVSLHARL